MKKIYGGTDSGIHHNSGISARGTRGNRDFHGKLRKERESYGDRWKDQ